MPSTQADRSATRDDRIDCAIHYCNARWRTKPRVTVEAFPRGLHPDQRVQADPVKVA